MAWMAWSINPDNGAGGDPAVWDRCRLLWTQNDIEHYPWLHCRTMADIERLISVGNQYASPAIGLNIEDVQRDFADKGISLQDIAQKVSQWQKPIHMATLPWVQNGQGWSILSRAVAALEIFPDENDASKQPAACIEHAFEEGLTKVTLMLKTKGHNPSDYGTFFKNCHSLYTADDITPTAPSWMIWKQDQPCTKPNPPMPPFPEPPIQTVRFTRVLGIGDFGSDVEGVARALCREGSGAKLVEFNKQVVERRRTWNDQKHDWLQKFETKQGAKPDGIYGKWIHGKLSPHFDARAIYLMDTWKPPPPPLIEPRQGFDSLHESLWDIYSVGRRLGLFDLGTYNPDSNLPSGAPSDHSVFPAFAFDLGIDPDTGYQHDLGRSFFHIALKRPEVEYVILGNRIGYRRTGLVSYYGYGGHQNHCHVSGNR